MPEDRSPVVKKVDSQEVKMLSFPSALVEVIAGKKVTKLEWGDAKSYVFMKDGFLVIHKSTDPEEESPSLIIREVDLIGMDWFVL